jgi:Lrp/AsnC family transcriptional regulator
MLRSPALRGALGRSCQFGHEKPMDRTDLRILAILQEDSSLPVAEVASRVNLSQTPCWRRIQKLEAQGVIERRVAILNPEAVGLGISVFVEIEASDHSPEWLRAFAASVAAMDEVMEVYRMAGDVDYLLRVAVGSMAEYDDFYRRLIAGVPCKNVTSRFAMERVKSTTAYPLKT